jgi:hypothetical protein
MNIMLEIQFARERERGTKRERLKEFGIKKSDKISIPLLSKANICLGLASSFFCPKKE